MSARLAVILILSLTACSRAAPTSPDWSVRVLPVDERVYKIDDEIGFESWHFGITIPESDAGIDELTLDYTSGGQTVASRRLTRHALQAFIDPGTTSGLALRNFHTQMPATLQIDAVRIRARLRDRVRVDRTVPLVRYQQKHSFRLPVRGCWFVSSGHDFGLEHRRWYTRSHFAWDLVRISGDGAPHAATGEALTNYYSYGQPVVAPAAGRVTLATDEHADNAPGELGERAAANFILLDHGDGEYTKLAHLAHGSVEVAVGDRVRAGQVLAKVGNSGLSDAPHLHVHVQGLVRDDNDLIIAEPPLPVQLSNYWRTSNAGARVWVESGRPRRGELLCTD